MTTYHRSLADVDLSVFGIRIQTAGSDGLITIDMPSEIEHVQGQLGDAVSYKTGNTTATYSMSILQSAAVNEDLLAVVNAVRQGEANNGEGEFFLKDRITGQQIKGTTTLDGYPRQVAQNAEESNYEYAGRIYDVEMTIV